MMNAAEVRAGVRDMSQRHPGGMTMTGSPRTAPTVLSMLASARRGLAEAADETSLGYLPPSDEVAGSVVFFASPLSAPVTGQILNVNAGAWMP